LCGLVFPYLYGCQNLQPVNPLFMNPPATGPQLPTSGQNPPTYGAAPTLQPPTTQGVVTSTGPTSGGIAGGASGAVPATGVTGPVNGGISSSSGPP
jgi:hypothetical protein